ncbi:MAG: site-2 protease family protein [Candidatus Lokiarchaeota archaeon]|nr:site-2 protease family protein [Candidatus Lokiarchaeota archaeon]
MILLEILKAFILSPWFIVSLLFWILVCVLIILLKNKKKSYYLFFPLIALFKTKRLNKYIQRIGKKAPRFWRVFWSIGVFLSFCFMIFSFWMLFSNIITYFIDITNPSIGTNSNQELNMEFLYWILPLIFLYTTHELSHGIAATAENVDLKSTGVVGLGFIFLIGFGAFVEVDEKELYSEKYSRNTRLRISSAGAYINIITAIIIFLCIIITPSIISASYAKTSKITKVLTLEEGGFNFGNLTNNDNIYAIKKEGSYEYISIDEYKGITINSILSNKTEGINCSVGDIINLKVYNSNSNTHSKKNITLGPRYDIGVEYRYLNDTAISIFYNYTSNQYINIIITEIEGLSINKSAGITLEKKLTEYNLESIQLMSNNGINYTLNLKLEGVFIGIQSIGSFMYKNNIGMFFTNEFPEIITKQLSWFFILTIGLIMFNLLPLFITDGDRMVKELVNSKIGYDYKNKKEKIEKFYLKKDEKDIDLSEYRIEKINSIKLTTIDINNPNLKNEIILGENNYNLFDRIGDGFKSTVRLKIFEKSQLKEGTMIEINYEYIYDNKKRKKLMILNTIRLITLILFVINFGFLFGQYGFKLFGISI